MIRSSTQRKLTDETFTHGRLVRVPYTSCLRDRLIIKQGKNHYSVFRKLISFANYLGQYFTFWLDPTASIYQVAENICKNEQIDAIIATGKPFVLFRYAYLLNNKFHIPWIADYRDGWADSYNRKYDALWKRVLNRIELYLERKFTAKALCLTTVTPFLANKIAQTINKKGFLIPNGVDVSLYAQEQTPFDRFTVSYTGIMYDFPYINLFEEAFRKFIQRHPAKDKQFLFVGIELQKNNSYRIIEKLCGEYPDYIRIVPRVTSQEAAHIHQQSHVLLNFIPRNEYMVLPVKTFGYAASRRPAIVVETIPNDDVFFFPNRDIQYFARSADDMLNLLEKFYEMYLHRTEIKTSITDEEIHSFSREARTQRFVEVLNQYLSL